MLNKKSLLLSLILSFVFGCVPVFANNLTSGRHVYGIISETFTGALQECGESVDNILCCPFSQYGAVTTKQDESVVKEGKYSVYCSIPKSDITGQWAGLAYTFVKSDNRTAEGRNIGNNGNNKSFKYLDFWIKYKSGNTSEFNNLLVGVSDFNAGDGNDWCKKLSETVVETDSDGWKHCVIDLDVISGSNLSNIKNVFLIKEPTTSYGNVEFYIDNIVLRTADSGSFNVTLEKVEDMQNVPSMGDDEVKWTESAIMSKEWQAAGRYIKIDVDKYCNNLNIQMYVNNGAKGRNGLVGKKNNGDIAVKPSGEEYVLPMCWRAYNGKLVNFVENPAVDATYLIAQSAAEDHNLYDYGVSKEDPGYYPWFYMKEYKDINFADQKDVDYITIWNSSKGYHVANPFKWKDDKGVWHDSDGFSDFFKADRTLRVYLGTCFQEMAGGLNYTATIIVNGTYE